MKVAAQSKKRDYEKVTQLEHVLLRPDTYVGSVPMAIRDNQYIATNSDITKPSLSFKSEILLSPAAIRVFTEILSNALDNISRSKEDQVKMTNIKVTFDDKFNEFSICNDGSWIPVEIHKKTGVHIPQLIFGELLTSSNYSDEDARFTSGRNGYGAKLTNIFSSKFSIEVFDGNKNFYKQEWSKNMTITHPPKITKRRAGTPYTKVTWQPDRSQFEKECFDDNLRFLYIKLLYDAAMVASCANVSVYLNDTKIPIKNLKDYSKLYGAKETLELSTKDSHVVVANSDTGYNHVAFTNGVLNSNGGVHVDAWITALFKPLLSKFNKKNKPQITVRDLKPHFCIIINCNLVNPTFTSQSKTKLATPTPKAYFSVKQINLIMKWTFASKIRDLIHSKELLSLKKTENKRKTFQKIPGYDPANNAGGKESAKCTLFITEGLSAKTYAVLGIQKGIYKLKGRDWNGIFPVRGKLLNVRNAKSSTIAANKEVSGLVNAIGLSYNVDYSKDENFSKLNYGRVALLCDADVDGIHIQGLLINMFHTLFPTLLQRKTPFVVSLETPLVRVFTTPNQIFYCERDFNIFMQDERNTSLRRKYHKGLGTSSNKEVLESFGEKIVEYHKDDEMDENLNKAFDKKFTNERKAWLANYDKNCESLIHNKAKSIPMKYSEFVDSRLIDFSIDDCKRSLPHLLDGLKESQRKILYSIFLKKLKFTGKTLKVAQLAGYVAEKTGYHHGEQCLYDTIIKMANDIVGFNNIPLLFRDGQFGTRIQGGKDAAAGRYIFTKQDTLTRALFPEPDDYLLPQQEEDGDIIEPEYYIPIIPMILVNGCVAGIGTGWSCSVPLYNPIDVIDSCLKWIDGGKDALNDLTPWYRNFKGKIKKLSKTKFITYGVIKRINDTQVEVSELPIGLWTDKFKENIEDLLQDKLIKSIKNYSTPKKVKFLITECKDGMRCNLNTLKLSSTITTSNLVLFCPGHKLRKFTDTTMIINIFCAFRLKLYKKRIVSQLKLTKQQLLITKNKYKFLQQVINKELIVFMRLEEDVIKDLEIQKYERNKGTFNYLLSMDIRSFTKTKMETLQTLMDKLTVRKTYLETIDEKTIWKEELSKFKQEYFIWQKKMKASK